MQKRNFDKKRWIVAGAVVAALVATASTAAAMASQGSASSPPYSYVGAVTETLPLSVGGQLSLSAPIAADDQYSSAAAAQSAYDALLHSPLIGHLDASNSGSATAYFGEFTDHSYAATDPNSNQQTPVFVNVPAWAFVYKNVTVQRHGGTGGNVNVTATIVVDARTDTPLLLNSDG